MIAVKPSQDIITPHITDSNALEVPCLSFEHGFACHLELPHWAPVHIGNFTVDLSPTKHVVMLLVAATLCLITMLWAARAHKKQHATGKAPKGFANGMESLVLYMRNEVIIPNVGHHGDKYVPFVLTLFFFILFANLLGLIPYGSTATGNISVTATLAIITFIVIELAGMRTLGKGYLNTVFYWPHDMPLGMKLPMTLIMTPVEIIGKFTKPFALAIRLFANMTAGHVVVLALIGLIFTFGSYFVAPAPFMMAVAIMLLEIFVAFLQAFIFSLLASVFIGQIREGAH
jgi:F-type H+-transporting ATPase subunit a